MSRSLWKPEYIHNEFLKQQENIKEKGLIILQNRSSRILAYMVGYQVQVYNGIRFFIITINADMVGHCIGEFAFTRQKPVQKKQKGK